MMWVVVVELRVRLSWYICLLQKFCDFILHDRLLGSHLTAWQSRVFLFRGSHLLRIKLNVFTCVYKYPVMSPLDFRHASTYDEIANT